MYSKPISLMNSVGGMAIGMMIDAMIRPSYGAIHLVYFCYGYRLRYGSLMHNPNRYHQQPSMSMDSGRYPQQPGFVHHGGPEIHITPMLTFTKAYSEKLTLM